MEELKRPEKPKSFYEEFLMTLEGASLRGMLEDKKKEIQNDLETDEKLKFDDVNNFTDKVLVSLEIKGALRDYLKENPEKLIHVLLITFQEASSKVIKLFEKDEKAVFSDEQFIKSIQHLLLQKLIVVGMQNGKLDPLKLANQD